MTRGWRWGLLAAMWGIVGLAGCGVSEKTSAEIVAMEACELQYGNGSERDMCLIRTARELGDAGGDAESWELVLVAIDRYEQKIMAPNEHDIVHKLGVASNIKLEVMADIDIPRRAVGFLHGWILQYFTEPEHGGREPDFYAMVYKSVCEAEQNLDLGADCAHGFGHAAYAAAKAVFGEARVVCDSAGKAAKLGSIAVGQCYAGLLMASGTNESGAGGVQPISWREAVDLCSGLDPAGAERCWPWTYWFYPHETGEDYVETCEQIGELARWCGRGIAMWQLFSIGAGKDISTREVMRYCETITEDAGSDAAREVALGCAIETAALHEEGWWDDGKPLCGRGRATCYAAVVANQTTPCAADHDIERVAACEERRGRGSIKSSR